MFVSVQYLKNLIEIEKVMQNTIVINPSKYSPLCIKINLIYIDVRTLWTTLKSIELNI